MAAFLSGRYVEALNHCDEAEAFFRNRCTGVTWELASAQMFSLWSLYFVGDLGALKRRVPVLLKEARDRGDLYALTNLRTEFVHLVELAADRPEVARREAIDAMNQWQNDSFNLEHFWELHTLAQIDLFEGRGREAHQRVEERWPALKASLLLTLVQQLRIEANYLRGRSALAAARDGERQPLQIADKAQRQLASENIPWSAPLAIVMRAGLLAARSGPAEKIGRLLQQAVKAFEASNLRLHAACARLRYGELGLGDSTQHREHAEAWLSDAGVKNPARMADMTMPPVRFPT
jgi:hypothetical protein